MARGWESKAVEDQMSSAQAQREAQTRPALSEAARERETRKQSLLLSRAKLLKDMEAATNERYRALLRRTLAHLDDELKKLGHG